MCMYTGIGVPSPVYTPAAVGSTAESSEDTMTIGAQTTVSTEMAANSNDSVASTFEINVLSRNIDDNINGKEICLNLESSEFLKRYCNPLFRLLVS